VEKHVAFPPQSFQFLCFDVADHFSYKGSIERAIQAIHSTAVLLNLPRCARECDETDKLYAENTTAGGRIPALELRAGWLQ